MTTTKDTSPQTAAASGETPALTRRGLFRLGGMGAGALGAAAGLTTLAVPEAEAARPAETSGYRETPHVLKVYELSRF